MVSSQGNEEADGAFAFADSRAEADDVVREGPLLVVCEEVANRNRLPVGRGWAVDTCQRISEERMRRHTMEQC